MTIQEQEVFEDYLRGIEDELLEAVSADYIWLASQYEEESPDARYCWRRSACYAECERRRKLRIWRRAEETINGAIPQVA